MALPRKGFSGVEKKADTTAWTNSIAESTRKQLRNKHNKQEKAEGKDAGQPWTDILRVTFTEAKP